jgi:hypothetical protein
MKKSRYTEAQVVDVVGDAGLHRWRHAEGLMHAGEIVEHEVERHGRRVILDLL